MPASPSGVPLGSRGTLRTGRAPHHAPASTSALPHASHFKPKILLSNPFLCLLANTHKSCLEITALLRSGSEADRSLALHPDLSFLGTARTPRLHHLTLPHRQARGSPAQPPAPVPPSPARRGGSRCVITSRAVETCPQLSLTVC